MDFIVFQFFKREINALATIISRHKRRDFNDFHAKNSKQLDLLRTRFTPASQDANWNVINELATLALNGKKLCVRRRIFRACLSGSVRRCAYINEQLRRTTGDVHAKMARNLCRIQSSQGAALWQSYAAPAPPSINTCSQIYKTNIYLA